MVRDGALRRRNWRQWKRRGTKVLAASSPPSHWLVAVRSGRRTAGIGCTPLAVDLDGDVLLDVVVLRSLAVIGQAGRICIYDWRRNLITYGSVFCKFVGELVGLRLVILKA